MSESQFLNMAAATLDEIETAVDASGAAVDCTRTDLVLTLECEDGTRMIINAQAPTRQLWLAARSGGMHFAHDGAHWRDVRSGAEFFEVLARVLSEQTGRVVTLSPP
jgi:CyaY protein